MTADIHRFPGMERLRLRPRLTIEDLRGRIGRFALADGVIAGWPEAVMKIMGSCIVVAAGRCEQHGSTTYVALCPEFDQLPLEQAQGPYPAYEWRFDDLRGCWRPYRLGEARAC